MTTLPAASATPGADLGTVGDQLRSPEESDMAIARGKHAPQSQPQNQRNRKREKKTSRGVVALTVVAVIFAIVPVVAPAVLSASDLFHWAQSHHGLGVVVALAAFVVAALDALAIACILVTLVCAMLDKAAGIFAWGAWVIAAISAAANYRFGTAPDAPTDRFWFFPLMSFLGPIVMHGAVKLIRESVQQDGGRRVKKTPTFGLTRWLPIVGSPKDTYGAYRTAQVMQIERADDAIRAYHELCPDGRLNVVRAIREREAAAAAAARDRAAWEEAQERAQAEWEAERARKDADRAADRAHRAPRGPRGQNTARSDKTARSRGSSARRTARSDWWTPARHDWYRAEYARVLDEEGRELGGEELARGVGLHEGNARNARTQYLRARYADEVARGERAPRDGVQLPPSIARLVAARAARGVTDEWQAIGERAT